MSEKEFWTKYSRAEYLHSTKNIVAAAAEAAEDEELAVFLKQDDMLVSEARRKVFHQIFTISLFSNKFHPKRTSTEYSCFPLLSLSLCLPLRGVEWRRTSRSLYILYSFQIRRVDPTLDMEADEGDDYMHLPVHQRSFILQCNLIIYFR